MTSHIGQEAGRTVSASSTKKAGRPLRVGFAAALLLSCSPMALHAETSNAELAKQIAELKAQIREMKGSISSVKKMKATKSPVVVAAPAPFVIPEGATPVFVNAKKQMQYGSLTITPGGFLDMYGIGRSKNLGAETSSPVNTIPTLNLNNAHVGEGRLSARNTRVALLIESPISTSMLISGYGELDFRAAANSSTPGQTNSFSPRIRQLYSALDNTDYGMHFLAGQAWSLVTPNSKGITPRNELLPPTLDNVVLPGFDYARTPQIRLVKDFNKKLWLGVSIENPQTAGIVGGSCTAAGITAAAATGVAGGTCVTASAAGTDFGGSAPTNISINKVPNAVAKIAYEARLAERDVHLEALGMYKLGTTYVNYAPGGAAPANLATAGYPASSQQNTSLGGVGANISFPVIVGKLDFQAGGEYGTGFGYYTSTGLPDVTVGQDGRIKGIKIESGYAGLIAHVTPSIDIYTYAGVDQAQRNFTQFGVGGAQVGYGAINGVNNTGCYVVGGTCAGATHRVYQITGGFSDKLYKGAFGEVRAAAQYSYTRRDLFSGTASATGPTAAAPLLGASTDEHIVMTSLRYFPFQ